MPPLRGALNILVVVRGLGGLWHGAAWTFVIWGALHGVALVTERLAGQRAPGPWRRLPAGLRAALRWALTFHLVVVAWVFFRAADAQQAWAVFAGLGHGLGAALEIPGFSRTDLAIGAVGIAVVELVEWRHEHGGIQVALAARPRALRWGLYAAALVGTLFGGVFTSRQFIYFQF